MVRLVNLFGVFSAACIIAKTVADVEVPDCQDAAPTQKTLNIKTANLSVSGNPFGLIYASSDIALAAIQPYSIGVLNTSLLQPTVIRELLLPTSAQAVTGIAITSDKKTLYASLGSGAVAIDVDKAIAGTSDFVVGFLNGTAGTSAIEVTLSADDKYAFVSQEYGNAATDSHGVIEVFQIHRDIHNGNVSNSYIGNAQLGYGVVGTALSTDGTKLYVTSEETNLDSEQGNLSVLEVATLKTNPSQALISSVDAGCHPVRVAVSSHNKHVWVTARESNKLLAFDAAKLETNRSAADALVASVQVGTSPVGLTFANHGRHIITADSNRFGYTNTTTGLTVVDVELALRGSTKGKGVSYGGFPRIPSGLFPREVAVSPDGRTLLVAQYNSKAIQAVDISQLH